MRSKGARARVPPAKTHGPHERARCIEMHRDASLPAQRHGPHERQHRDASRCIAGDRTPLLLSSSSCVCSCDEGEGGDTALSTAFGLGVRSNMSTALAASTGAALLSWARSWASIKAEAVPVTTLVEEDEEASAPVRSRDCEVHAARSRDCDVDAARSRDCDVDAARSRDCEVGRDARDAATDFAALSMASYTMLCAAERSAPTRSLTLPRSRLMR